MTKASSVKLKLLHLRRILEEETDASSGLSMAQIISRLQELGFEAERKSVYRDIQTLREFGLDIITIPRRPVEYALGTRDFSLSELMLLVDAVESCRFLTERQSRALITNLKLQASDNERALLDRRIHVSGRIASKSESVFGSIDILHDAMRRRRKVEFRYLRYGPDGRRVPTRKGRLHKVTPVGITFSDGFYYLSAWDDEHDDMAEYRIDRMERLRVTDDAATRNDTITQHTFDGDGYESFGRFGGTPATVTLVVDADKIEIILDRFGSAAELHACEDEQAEAIVRVHVSEQFFGWLAGLGGTVRIGAPAHLRQEYHAYLGRLIDEDANR